MDADRIFFRYLERPGRRRLTRLAKSYYSFVWATAARVTGNQEDAADITQDVFLKLLLHPPRPEEVKSPRGYLAWEVIGRATNVRRAEERRAAREKAGVLRAHEDGLDPDEIALLRSAVLELPEDQRAAIELRYFAGLRNQDIAAALGVGERHVEKRLEKARETLRERLKHAAPLLAFLAAGEAGIGPSPPPRLWSRLRRVVAMGGAIAVAPAKVAVTAAAGTALLAKKVALTATAAALVAALPIAAWRAWETSRLESAARIRSAGSSSTRFAAVAQLDADGARASAVQQAEEPAEPPRASVHGHVVDDDGKVVAGAAFSVSRDLTEEAAAGLREQGYRNVTAGLVRVTATCDEAGLYSMNDLLPGKYRCGAAKEGMLEQCHYSIRLDPGQDREAWLRLCHPFRVHGTVKDPAGNPIPGAQVFVDVDLSRPDNDDPALDLRGKLFLADEEGRFDAGFDLCLFVPINETAYGFVVAPGHELQAWRIEKQDFKDGDHTLEVVLEPEERLLVRVRDPQGAPVAGAAVSIGCGDYRWGQCWSRYQNHATDERGEAALENLPRKGLEVFVEKDGFESGEARVEPGAETVLDVVLGAVGAEIGGQVVFDEAIPAPNRKVDDLFLHELNEALEHVRTAREVSLDRATGRFSAHPRRPMHYRLVCDTGLVQLQSEPFYFNGRDSVRKDFHIRLEPPYVSGKVVRAGTDDPLAGVPVTICQPSRDAESDRSWGNTTIVNGFRFSLLPGNTAKTTTAENGSFLLALQGPDSSRAWTLETSRIVLLAGSDEIGWSQERYVDLNVKNDTVVSDVKLEVLGWGAIEGRVQGLDGAPAPGVLAVAYDGRSVLQWKGTDRDGNYRIEKLRPGTYTVEVIGDGPDPKLSYGGAGSEEHDFPPPRDFFERPVTVEEGQTSRWDIDLRTGALGSIDGTLPEPLRGATAAECALIVLGRPRYAGPLGVETPVRDGRFRFEHLLPGRYLVRIEKERSRIAQAEVVVRRGPPTPLTMPVPSASLSIPLRGLPPDEAARVKVAYFAIRPPWKRDGDFGVWEPWAGFKVALEGADLKIEQLPVGLARLTLYAPGWQAVRLDSVVLTDGSEAALPAVEFIRGHTVRVRVEAPAGTELPADVSFTAWRAINEEELPFTPRREGAEPVWTLSGLPPGDVQLSTDAGPAFEWKRVDVALSATDDAEVTVRLTRRPP